MRKFKNISICCFVLFAFFSCQKMSEIDKIEPFSAFYVSSFNTTTYAETDLNYEFNLADSTSFELKLNIVGGSGFSVFRVYQLGIVPSGGSYLKEEVTQNFTISLPALGSKSGTITMTGIVDYSKYRPGIQSEGNKYTFPMYLVDEMGNSRIVTIKLVKP